MSVYKLGIDMGGSKIEGVILDYELNECYRHRVDTGVDEGYEVVLNRIRELYKSMFDFIEGAPHTLGIGIPGSISRATGLLKNCNAFSLNGKPLAKDIQACLGRTFAIDNDANYFAHAEAQLGAGKGYANVLGVVLGTGCGAGIVIRNLLHVGRHSIAGEWGHMSIDPDGPACYCGRKGCVERYISGTALQVRFEEKSGLQTNAATIVDSARKGDRIAVAVLEDFLDHFGAALANVIAVLDPDVVVVGGGLSNIDEIYTRGASRVKKYIFNDTFDVPILRNQLGDSSGVLGAAMLGR